MRAFATDQRARNNGIRRSTLALEFVLLLLSTPALSAGTPPNANCHVQVAFAKVGGLLNNKSYDRARSELDQLRNCGGLSEAERFNLGWLFGRARDFHSALDIFHSLPAKVPDLSTHLYAIALSEFELGDYQSVVTTLKSTQPERQLDARSANLLGVSYSKLGLYREAYTVLTEHLHHDPHDGFAYLNLVALFADSGDYSHAAQVATQATTVFPKDSEMFLVLGAADSLEGDYSKAHDDLEKAVQLSPHLAQPRFLLAVSDYKRRDLSRAVNDIRDALADGIVDSDLHYLFAQCLFELDPTKDAEISAELNRAIAINPKNISARTMRGTMLLKQHHPKEAIADLELAHQMDPNSRNATYALARALMATGRKDEAKNLSAQLNGQVNQDLENQRRMEEVEGLSKRRLKEALAGENPR